jgi:hypothetical protein
MHWIDHEHLPATRGKVARLLFNPHGDMDGLLFQNGMEVHIPPHLSSALVRRIRPGDSVKVRGLRVRDRELLVAVAVEPSTGKPVIDQGPGEKKGEKKKKDAAPAKVERWGYSGTVERPIHGPRGDVHGALLDDGVLLRFPPHAAAKHAGLFEKGQTIDVEGGWHKNAHGVVIAVDHAAPAGKALRPID